MGVLRFLCSYESLYSLLVGSFKTTLAVGFVRLQRSLERGALCPLASAQDVFVWLSCLSLRSGVSSWFVARVFVGRFVSLRMCLGCGVLSPVCVSVRVFESSHILVT